MPYRTYKIGDIVVVRGYLPYYAKQKVENIKLTIFTGCLGEVIGVCTKLSIQVKIFPYNQFHFVYCNPLELEYLGEL